MISIICHANYQRARIWISSEIKNETLQKIKGDLELLVAAKYLTYETTQVYVDMKENGIVLKITISDMSSDFKTLIKEASEYGNQLTNIT